MSWDLFYFTKLGYMNSLPSPKALCLAWDQRAIESTVWDISRSSRSQSPHLTDSSYGHDGLLTEP